jgi:hypothetical protein
MTKRVAVEKRMSEERIMTLHPDNNKRGVNIDKEKYESMRKTIICQLRTGNEMSFKQLGDAVGKKLENNFSGSISWYYTTVKLDLEARGIIKRIGKSSPQMLRLNQNYSDQ